MPQWDWSLKITINDLFLFRCLGLGLIISSMSKGHFHPRFSWLPNLVYIVWKHRLKQRNYVWKSYGLYAWRSFGTGTYCLSIKNTIFVYIYTYSKHICWVAHTVIHVIMYPNSHSCVSIIHYVQKSWCHYCDYRHRMDMSLGDVMGHCWHILDRINDISRPPTTPLPNISLLNIS